MCHGGLETSMEESSRLVGGLLNTGFESALEKHCFWPLSSRNTRSG